ncbi:16S rRNA (guanine(527)-N(7))-methyltransferase RsmG [Calidifontibacillus erzurumensis]|uniref:Ribosomal RNA small subunit methyltransferase G n=1 Tax=Calidifontibacillus erzurumensis TaxID=2741433 RepID=A0A8J8KF00_9BACI|nr:16S rRNA (guanine(527)-N(7))-methyltransferase RsmG [Calidifontibacillus erzurumensis]NSL52360.1 16S rRNA (guanine(527)-N(7))-methyltransferase RsmG [Calidifontibacillus erzurumensis]
MDIGLFQNSLAEKGILLTSKQLEQFDLYYRMLVEWNEKMNLTAITDEPGVYLKHFYDSITAAFYFDFSKDYRLCDVGAGAGFPSIPLKICFPHLSVSIVDSLQKRISFLNELANKLQLENVSFYHDRAETFAKDPKMRESFDVVMARAVARMSVLSELCLPLVKVGGYFIAMKGANFAEEMEAGKKAVDILGGTVLDIHHFQLPIENSERNIAIIKKERKTPNKYPRKPGTPNRNPIE